MSITPVDVHPLKDLAKKKTLVDVVSDGNVGLDTPVEPQMHQDNATRFAIFYKYIPEALNLSGIKYAFNPKEVRWRRIIWLLILLAGVAVLTLQITDRIRHYLSTPVSVDMVYEHQDSVPFPSVAICNINAFKVRWDRQIFNHSVMTVRMTDWGICFVFNDIDNGKEGLVVTNAGSARGLEIFLNANQAEYFFQPKARYGAGFKVLLYDRGTEPEIQGKSFAIATGVQTWVGVDIIETNNLEEPYGQCREKTLNHFPHYSHVACELECLYEFLIGQCGCKTLAMSANYTSDGCDCPMACFSRQYVESVSFSNFPSDFMASIIAESFRTTPSNVQKNVCAVNIFMKDLTIQKISQQADYTVASLMSDIGGSLGLWLGGSVLTLFELVDLIGYSAYIHSRSIPHHKKP
ncbi:acid-sensing ion channel 2-like [Diadema antillarum]|uniref:acid-sensing ion channel 2-like n=1 Tax=Diadema antillarum TaxID=105358 RepID=UPI003A884A48